MSTTSTTRPTAPAKLPVVAALGDSELAGAADDLTADLPGVDLHLYDAIGLTIDDAQFGLAGLQQVRPIAIGIVLGTNDVLRGDPNKWRDSIERMAERLDAIPCVRWVDVAQGAPNDAFNRAAADFNRELVDVSSERSHLRIILWSNRTLVHPEWFDADGVHFKDDGNRELARMLAEGLQSCRGVRGRDPSQPTPGTRAPQSP